MVDYFPTEASTLPTIPAPTQIDDVEQGPKTQTEQPVATHISAAVEVTITAEIETPSQVHNETAPSLLSFVVFIALMWAISSASLADKRPVAIYAIDKTISSRKFKGESRK